IISVVFILLLYSINLNSQYREKVIFYDDFNKYKNGSSGLPVWIPVKGEWKIVDGKYYQGSHKYDCGAMLNIFLSGDYIIETSIRYINGEPGAGFFFNSESFEKTEFSQMLRFESSKSMILGKFSPSGYDATSAVKVKFNDHKWHKLKVYVNGEKYRYSVYMDDKIVAEDIQLFYNSGFPGLECSGSEFEFDDFKIIKVITGYNPSKIHWVRDFIFDNNNNLVIPDRINGLIRIFDLKGNVLREVGTPEKQFGQLKAPALITLSSSGDFIVMDNARKVIHIFDKKGVWKNSFGSSGKFFNPVSLATDDNDNIFVLDNGDNKIKVFNIQGKFVAEFGQNRLKNPSDMCISGGKIYIVNRNDFRVEIYLWDGVKAKWISFIRYGSGNCRGIAVKNDFIYLSIDNSVKKIDFKGNVKKSYLCKSIGYFYPWKLRFGPDNKLYISDYSGSRIIITDKNLTDIDVKIDFLKSDEVSIEWKTPEVLSSEIVVKKDRKEFLRKKDEEKLLHKFVLSDLGFSRNYRFHIKPVLNSIPSYDGFSREFSFTTKAGKGTKQYWHFPAVALIFTNVFDKKTMKDTYPPMPPLEKREIERFIKQIKDAERFYWFTSNLNFHLDVDIIVVDDKLERSEVFDNSPYYYPLKDVIIKYITEAGKRVSDYYGVLYMVCVRDYDEKSGHYYLRGKGGAFTEGINTGDGYGISWWEVTKKDHSSGNNWLMTHEFNHQLDILFLNGGHPEYWFNHFNPNIGTAAKFGEHFDGNAYIMRMVPRMNWLDLKSGDLRVTADRDEDGIPDDEPCFPADEKRLGSSPYLKDTDGDGLSDFDEIAVSNWIVEGVGETYGGKRIFPDLNNPDTDGDGIPDGKDLYPVYPFKPEIEYRTPMIDGIFSEGEWTEFAVFDDPAVKAEIFMNWDSTKFYIGIITDRKIPFKVQIDFNADGWFIGRDNYLVEVEKNSNGKFSYSVNIFNASDLKRWPFMDRELSKKKKIDFAYSKKDNKYFFEIGIPQDPDTGIDLFKNEIISFNVGFKDKNKNNRYLTLFEPNTLFDAKLIVH
ncbi:hypothetical protein DRQ09_04720, partial [candidate division KSB1 bacterium]